MFQKFHNHFRISRIIGYIFFTISATDQMSAASAENVEHQGMFSKIGESIQSGIKKVLSIFAFNENDNTLSSKEILPPKDVKDNLKNNAKVPDTLYVEYAGPKSSKSTKQKHEVSIEEVEKQLAPLPDPEQIDTQPESKKIQEAIIKQGKIESMQMDANLNEDLHNQELQNKPAVPVANSIHLEAQEHKEKKEKFFSEQNQISK